MWIYAKTQRFPNPPRYSADRAQLVKDTATAFMPIDIYAGEPLAVGDLLVYRYITDPIGHVVIVRTYDSRNQRAEIIEAAQSAGTVRERTLELSVDPINLRQRAFIPGLWDLRLKPVSNHACSYRDSPARGGVRQPAAAPKGGAK